MHFKKNQVTTQPKYCKSQEEIQKIKQNYINEINKRLKLDQQNLLQEFKQKICYAKKELLTEKLPENRKLLKQKLSPILLYASREINRPINITYLSHLTNISKTKILKEYKKITNKNQIPQPIHHIKKYSNILEISDQKYKNAKKIAKKAIKLPGFSGSSPASIAASILHLCTGLSTKKISEISHVSDASIQQNKKKLINHDLNNLNT